MPCRDSGLPHDTRNIKRPSAQERRSYAVFNNSKNVASSCLKLGPDAEGNTKRPKTEMRREPQNSSRPVLHFQSGGGMLNHTGGTCPHSGMMDYLRIPIPELNLAGK